MHVSVIRIHLHVFLGFSVLKIFSLWLEHRTEAMSSASPVDEALSSGAVYAGTREARSGKLERARSRLYRGQILQENMCLKALAEIYTMHSFAQL